MRSHSLYYRRIHMLKWRLEEKRKKRQRLKFEYKVLVAESVLFISKKKILTSLKLTRGIKKDTSASNRVCKAIERTVWWMFLICCRIFFSLAYTAIQNGSCSFKSASAKNLFLLVCSQVSARIKGPKNFHTEHDKF